jgi:hypothetical protein
MKNSDLVEIIKSPAFTILVGTLCFAFILKQVKPVMKPLRTPEKL